MKVSFDKIEGRRAFTRVDLLMVIASLGILAGLFLPALAKARDQGRKIQCSSNLQHIGLAFEVYADEHNGQLMPPVGGVNAQGKVIGYDEALIPSLAQLGIHTNYDKVFTCPNQKRTDYPRLPGFGMNAYCSTNPSSVTRGFLVVLITETRGTNGAGSHLADPQSQSPGELDNTRHNGGANYLFADGHVFDWRPAEAADQAWWGGNQMPRHSDLSMF